MERAIAESMRRLALAVRLFLPAVAAVFVSLAVAGAGVAAEIRVAAPPATIERILKPLKAPFERATGITLSIQDLDGRDALPLLKKGKLDMVATSQTAEVYLREAAAHGVAPESGTIRTFVVRRVPLAVIVHNSSTISSLSREQLKGIFSGSMRSWEEVGGKDDPIDVFLYEGYSPDAPLTHAILGDQEVFYEARRMATPEEARVAVAEDPAGIAVIPADLLNGSVKKLEAPEISHLPAFMTYGEPSERVRTFIDFALGEGQKHLKLTPGP